MTRELILGTAGHIDHGKTALVRALTGVDTDRLAEEKKRGISIDIGFAHLDAGDTRFGIVDVPGHERFIRNMLAGASGVDVALLVVAADDSVMPQTREHLAILEMLRVQVGVIAITKADLVEPSWLDLVEEDVRTLVRGTFLESARIVRTSATTGAGLEELTTALLEAAPRHAPREATGGFRMSIDRAFVLQGLGTVVTGTVASGAVSVGDVVEWLPVGRPLRVRSIQSHGADVENVGQGRRAALDVAGAHHTEIQRGHVVATSGHLAPSRLVTARLRVLAESPWPVKHRSCVRLYVGTQEAIARVRLLAGTAVPPGADGLAQLVCDEPVVAVARQPIVLRSESPLRTIGGGVILQPVAEGISRRDAASIERVGRLEDGDERVRVATAVYFAAASGWTSETLGRDADVTAARLGELLAALERDGTIVSIAVGSGRTLRLHRDRYRWMCERVTAALERLHAASPLARLVPRQRLAAALPQLDGDVVAGVVERMRSETRLTGDDAAVALPQRAPVLTDAQRQARERILAAYRDGGFSPPDPAKLAAATAMKVERVRALIALSASEGELVHLEGEMYLHREWADALEQRITDALSRGDGGLTVSQIKEHLGTSRKFAVPMCEHLDRIGVTTRRGDVRVRGASG